MKFIAAFLALGLIFFVVYDFTSTGPLAQDTTIILAKGQGFRQSSEALVQAGVIRNALLFEGEALMLGQARKFKAGEYHFSAGSSAGDVMAMLATGHVVIHKITIPEGLTVADVTMLLTKEPVLTGNIPANITEGELLPETYHFTYGDTREEVVSRMEQAMSKALAELWEKRAPDLPFTDPAQAVVLASIVEKETGVDSERPRVAAVFINRLRKGMMLQSDPTTKYAIEKDRGPLNRALTTADLAYDSPYNTYKTIGLPPAPICNPGKAALEAVLNPFKSDELYFVATGTGGHHFASTLKQHEENVKAYREQKAKSGN